MPPIDASTTAIPRSRWTISRWPLFLFGFGFLLASFPARNADTWGHLANGRQIWGHFDFSGTVSPLFNAIVYATHFLGGEFLAVFVKAIVVGLLGLILYRATRASVFGVLPVMVVGLILLAISLRVNLQPQVATYILLGSTVLAFQSKGSIPTSGRGWILFGLFALAWVNLDRGFVYGLVLIASIIIGNRLDGSRVVGFGKGLLGAIAILTAACFLNPSHWSGDISPPVELRWVTTRGAGAELRSPMTLEYFRSIRESPAALAYYPLLLSVALGFVWNRPGFRWARFLPSALFAGLSIASDRAIPLFAVVAGPFAALNLSEAWVRQRRQEGAGVPRRRWLIASLQITVAAAFLLAAWPGWLQRAPYEPRRWAFDLPTSPAAAADYLRTERATSVPDGRTLHVTAESRMAFRWHCPEDDGEYEPRLVSNLVEGRNVEAGLKAGRFDRIVVYHSDLEQTRPALNALLRDRYRWPLLYLRGGVAIFGRRDAGIEDRGNDLSKDWIPSMEASREAVPGRAPEFPVPTWQDTIRDTFTRPRSIHSQHREEAVLLILMAEVSQFWIPQVNGIAWSFEHVASLVGGASSLHPLHAATGTAVRFNYAFPPMTDSGPPAHFYLTANRQFEYAQASRDDFLPGTLPLAMRAARRALSEDSGDSVAWLVLGEAYLKLLFDSRERVWNREFRLLRELRQAQAATALYRAIETSPVPSAKAHTLASLMFRRIGYFDLALQHLEASRRADRRNPSDPATEKDYERLRDDVNLQRERFDKESSGLRLVDQARLADELKLPGLALELLMKSDISAFGITGSKHQLELMVRTGRARQVIEWTSSEQRDAVGFRNYHGWRAQAFAGLGDYDSADAELVEIGGGPNDVKPDAELLVSTIATIVSKNVLGEAPKNRGLVDAVGRMFARIEAVNELRATEARLTLLGEVSGLRGALALEAGDRRAARRHGAAVLVFVPQRPSGLILPLRDLGQSLVDRGMPPD